MRYGNIKFPDIANGEGIRVSLFVSGCRLNCNGCFNKMAQDFKFGKEYTEETQKEIIDLLGFEYVSGLSLLGGDPLEPEHQETLINLCKEVKEKYPTKNIWMWTGREFEFSWFDKYKIMEYIDVLIDGRFEQDKYSILLRYRGSSNQRVINLVETKKQNKIILIDIPEGK